MSARSGRAHAAAAAIVCITALAGCAGTPSTASQKADDGIRDGSSAASSAPSFVMAPITGEKSASSIADHIQQYLDQPDIISAYEQPILERARDNGGLTAKQYEEAWSHFRMCMAGKGYPSLTIKQYANGIYDQGAVSSGQQDEWSPQFGNDKSDCYFEIGVLNQVYMAQIGNPDFYANQSEVIVDCLHRNSLVAKDYTVQRFVAEKDARNAEGLPAYSFNLKDRNILACFAANGSTFGGVGFD